MHTGRHIMVQNFCFLMNTHSRPSPFNPKQQSSPIQSTFLIVDYLTFIFFFLVKLFPDCAPHSVEYILELLAQKHCAGCQFYRAEGQGMLWDSNGNHMKNVRDIPPSLSLQPWEENASSCISNMNSSLTGTIWPSICADPRNTRSPRNWIPEDPHWNLPNHQKRLSCLGWKWPRVLHKPGKPWEVEEFVHCVRFSSSRRLDYCRENLSAPYCIRCLEQRQCVCIGNSSSVGLEKKDGAFRCLNSKMKNKCYGTSKTTCS